jgi:hypothetical protein
MQNKAKLPRFQSKNEDDKKTNPKKLSKAKSAEGGQTQFQSGWHPQAQLGGVFYKTSPISEFSNRAAKLLDNLYSGLLAA